MAKTYNPKDVAVIWNGRQLTGFADGTFVVVARDSESFTDQAGADGEVARAKSNDRRGSITVTLMQTSDSNRILSEAVNADEANASGIAAAAVKDNSGASLHSSRQSWIQKPADAEYGKELAEREWVIRCADLETLIAGN